MTVEKPKPKQLLRPITTGTNSAMSQSQFLAITSNSLEAREKSRVHGASGFGFASHWLKNWSESFKPITKRSNRNHVITFDSHLKTSLSRCLVFKTDGNPFVSFFPSVLSKRLIRKTIFLICCILSHIVVSHLIWLEWSLAIWSTLKNQQLAKAHW